MNTFVFGGSPDALAGQQNFYDQTNIELAQKERDLQQRQIDEAQRQQAQADEQAQAQDPADAQFRFQAQQEAAANAENQYRFNLGRQDEQAANAESKRQFDTQTALTKQQIAAQTGGADYSEAYNAIANGDVVTPDDLAKSFPSLTPIQKQRAAMYLQQKKTRDVQDYQQIAAGAAAATGAVRPPTTQTVTKGGWFSSPTTNTVPAVNLTEDQAMASLASMKQFAKVLPHLVWNEEDQKFEPAIKPPAGFVFPGLAVPPPSMTVPAPVAPGTPPSAPPFQFSPGVTNMAASTPTRVQIGQTPVNAPAPTPPTGPKQLNEDMARIFLQQAGGDKNKARAMAKAAGYTW
jgi:hypothetical protein